MADNITLNTGSGGDTLAANDISGVKHQRVKIQHGAAGSATDVSTSSPLPADLYQGGSAVAAGNAIYVQPGTAAVFQVQSNSLDLATQSSMAAAVTALQILDDWDELDRCAVNPISGQVGVAAGSGAVGNTTQRVTLATDVALPSGDNNIGNVDVVTLPALPAGSNNIGDVDIATIAAGDNNIGNVDIVTFPSGNLGQQAMAASLSVVPANNITDATYIGDIKFGEELPAGTQNIGDVDVASIAAGTNVIGAVAASSSTLYDGSTACTIKRQTTVEAASGDNQLLAAVSGKKFRILALSIIGTSATAVNAYLHTTTDTDVLGSSTNPIPIAVDADADNIAGFTLPFNPGGWTETSTANEALNINLSGAVAVVVALTYIEVT